MRRCSWRRHTFSGEESASFLSRTSSQSKFSWAQCSSEKRTSDPEPRASLLMDQILHQFTWWISPVSILQSISMLYLSQLVQDWLFFIVLPWTVLFAKSHGFYISLLGPFESINHGILDASNIVQLKTAMERVTFQGESCKLQRHFRQYHHQPLRHLGLEASNSD